MRSVSKMSFPETEKGDHFVILSRSVLFSFLKKEDSRKNIFKDTLKWLIFKGRHIFLGMISIYSIRHHRRFCIRFQCLQEVNLDWDINYYFSEYYTLLFRANSILLLTFDFFTRFPYFPYNFLNFTYILTFFWFS